MADIFLRIVNMSISASWSVLTVLFLRWLLKKAPKRITILLWGIVAVRLICPFSIESTVSLLPVGEAVSPEIMTDPAPRINFGVSFIDDIINPVIRERFAPDPAASANPLQIWIPVLALVWFAGMAAMLLYAAISYFKVKNKIGTAVLLRDHIYQSENVVSPFVLGITNPKIYLPIHRNEQDTEHVIAHENAHIRRKDHLWKPFGFLLLALHWFNPLMWLGYVILCRDIELACDEKVIKEFDRKQKADYSQALLTCSVNRRIIANCPLAFGEVGVKSRVKSVLNYKKHTFGMIAISVVISIIAASCFLTNPKIVYDVTLSATNWTSGGMVYANALNAYNEGADNLYHFPIYKFDSLAELNQFKRTYGGELSMEGDFPKVPSLNEATAKYTANFFKENSLILIYIPASNTGHRFDIGKIERDEKSIRINVVETTCQKVVNGSVTGWFLTGAIKKITVASCTEFDAILNSYA